MVQRRQRERSLFEVLLPDGHKLWPEWLRKIDTPHDDAVLDVVARTFEARWSRVAVTVVLRRRLLLLMSTTFPRVLHLTAMLPTWRT